MTRRILKTAVALVASIVTLGAATTANADDWHRRHERGRDFSIAVGVGGFGGYYGNHGGGWYGGPSWTYGHNYGYAPVVVETVRPSCCHVERVYVSGHFTECGRYVPGYVQFVRVCDVHGRHVLSGY